MSTTSQIEDDEPWYALGRRPKHTDFPMDNDSGEQTVEFQWVTTKNDQ